MLALISGECMRRKALYCLAMVLLMGLFLIFYESLSVNKKNNVQQIGRSLEHQLKITTFSNLEIDYQQPLGLYFMASWCHTCEVEYQQFKAHQHDRQWIAVLYFDQWPKAKASYPDIEKVFDGYVVDQDGSVALDWGVRGTPEILLFERGLLARRVMRVKDLW
jgi:hypothetical protein